MQAAENYCVSPARVFDYSPEIAGRSFSTLSAPHIVSSQPKINSIMT